jgi:hypothetical protein
MTTQAPQLHRWPYCKATLSAIVRDRPLWGRVQVHGALHPPSAGCRARRDLSWDFAVT